MMTPKEVQVRDGADEPIILATQCEGVTIGVGTPLSWVSIPSVECDIVNALYYFDSWDAFDRWLKKPNAVRGWRYYTSIESTRLEIVDRTALVGEACPRKTLATLRGAYSIYCACEHVAFVRTGECKEVA